VAINLDRKEERTNMKVTRRAKHVAAGVAGVAMAAAIAGAANGAQGSPAPSSREPNVEADIASGKARRLPEGPQSWTYTSLWRNCGFVFIKAHNTRYMNGDIEVAVMDANPADVEAQVPPVDHACDGAEPTGAQLADERARMQALSDSAYRAARPGQKAAPPLAIPPHV